jgi:hypothetical protein
MVTFDWGHALAPFAQQTAIGDEMVLLSLMAFLPSDRPLSTRAPLYVGMIGPIPSKPPSKSCH